MPVVDGDLGQLGARLEGHAGDDHEHAGDDQHARVLAQQPPQRQPAPLARRSACWVNDDVGLAVVGLLGQELVDAGLQLGRDPAEGQPGRRAPDRGAARPLDAPRPIRRPRPSVAADPSSRPRRSSGARSRRPGPGPRRRAGCWPAARRGCRRPRCARPSSSTTRSARLMVDSRWAMIRVVRPSMSTRRASWICCSTWTSMALVASSRTRIGGFTSRVRAMAMRWR